MHQYRGIAVGRVGARGHLEAVAGQAGVKGDRVPYDLVVAEQPEIVLGKAVPQSADPLLFQPAVAQLQQRGVFALPQQFLGPAGLFYVHPQRPFRLAVQVLERPGLPGRPQVGVGATHVGHGQQVKVVQVDLVAHQAGEIANDRGVVDVLLLGGHRQLQVVLYQPRRQGRLAGIQAMVGAELFGLAGAQLRVIAAAALGDIVEKPGYVEHGGVFDSLHDLRQAGILAFLRGQGEPAEIAHHAQDVRIDRVAVKEVVLHPAGNQPELRNVGAQDSVAVHRLQLAGRIGGRGQHLHEGAAVLRVLAETPADRGRGFRQPLHQGAAEAADIRMRLPQQEGLQQRPRRVPQQVGPLRVEVTVAQQKARVDAPLGGAGAADDLAQSPENDFIEQRDAAGGPVIALHELLDGAVAGLIVKTEDSGKLFLVLKQEPVFHAARVYVERKAHLRKEIARPAKRVQLLGRNQSPFGQGFERGRSEAALENPMHRVQVAQSARSVLDIRLQIGGGVAVIRVAPLLFPELGPVKLHGGPDAAGIDGFRELPEQPGGAGQKPRFQQRRHDRDVGAGLVPGLRHGPCAVPRLEPHVPQKRQKCAHFRFGAARITLRHQDQHVDVRRGVHLLAAVAAYSQQGGAAQRGAGVQMPQPAKQFVQLSGPPPQQFRCAFPTPQKSLADALFMLPDADTANAELPFTRTRQRQRLSGRSRLFRVQPDRLPGSGLRNRGPLPEPYAPTAPTVCGRGSPRSSRPEAGGFREAPH